MAVNPLLSTVLMGLILLVIVAGVLQLRNWRSAGQREDSGSSYEAIGNALHDPTVWTVTFLVLVAVAIAGALAVVGALPIPESIQPIVGTALLAITGVVIGGFVFAGVYSSVRGRGFGSAPAVGVAAVSVGFLVLLVVVVQLFLG